MSTLTVTAERLVIHEHPNADALELAQVGLYRAVVAKGLYRSGDVALYIPEGAVLPEALIAELGLSGRLGGKLHDRVTPVRLRGELSQGLVCRPAALDEWFAPGGALAGRSLETLLADRTDVAAMLGATKWVPPIPPQLAGEMFAAPDLVPWLEVENIRRYPDIFVPGEPVVATEKVHGSACLATVLADGTVFVTSKGFGHQRLAIRETPGNLYWRAVRGFGVPDAVGKVFGGAQRIGVFGEVYGKGVQDLAYGTDTGVRPGFAVFDVWVDGRWLDPAELVERLDGVLPLVPALYTGPYDEAAMVALADGRTVLGDGAHIREGIVIRPARDRYAPVLGGRAIGKLISPAYVTRKGGTEYE
jgi:RNA ligase (TIGR02306 family)